MKLAPIALFVYNRPWHTKETIKALQKNEYASESDLIIFSDGNKAEHDEKAVQEVRTYIKSITGFKSLSIVEREKNFGLAGSIISGVSELVNKYGTIIVLEDDLITSPVFLQYMNEGLTKYENEESIISIHGYVYPISGLSNYFFLKGADCWGWATWKRGWDNFEPNSSYLLGEIKKRKLSYDFDFGGSFKYTEMLENQVTGKISSWAIRWYASAYLKNLLTLYPGKSYVQNIGFGELATHTQGSGENYNSKMNIEFNGFQKIPIQEDKKSKQRIRNYFLTIYTADNSNLTTKIKGKIRNLVWSFFK